MMPVMTGIQAIQEIRAFYSQMSLRAHRKAEIQDSPEPVPQRAKFTPPIFVMFSIYQQKGFQEFAKGHGVDYFINKPPKQEEILNIVMETLKMRRR